MLKDSRATRKLSRALYLDLWDLEPDKFGEVTDQFHYKPSRSWKLIEEKRGNIIAVCREKERERESYHLSKEMLAICVPINISGIDLAFLMPCRPIIVFLPPSVSVCDQLAAGTPFLECKDKSPNHSN